MEAYKPTIDNLTGGYKATVRFLPSIKTMKSNSFKQIHWISEQYRKEFEIIQKRKLRIQKLNKLNENM